MQWLSFQRWFLLVVLLMCGITGAVKAQQKDVASHLSLEHREVVQQWLASSKLALRVATIADNSNKEGLAITRKERGKGYHPYYAVGDFNGDRKQDFAIALINERKRKAPFAIAIFNGPISKNSLPAYFEEGWDLSDGGLMGDKTGIMAGVFESDDCVIFRKSGKKYVVKDCLEG
ncbi:MAG: hypothetical protein H0W58_08955 [Acidobacteria bacterium]|nr:hypothetical protein [Acidobacteriota bacterium]